MFSQKKAKGQALAEFALILIVLLIVVFVIIEASRIMWAWVTVQNAARTGTRYAITGSDDCDANTDRLGCVISATYRVLNTLPLNDDPNQVWEDDNYYLIEVWGEDEAGNVFLDYPGAAGRHVAVRVYYRVPIVTPLLRPIRESLMVYSELILLNEGFNNLGGDSAGVGLPPPLPTFPTPGVTPSPTPTDTPGPIATSTTTPTITLTPGPTRCDTHFDTDLVQGDTFVNITGDVNTDVIVYDLSAGSTPPVLATGVLLPFSDHDCPGFANLTGISPPLIGGNSILVSNNTDFSEDTSIVLTAPPTPTPTDTNTPAPLPTSTPTETPTSTLTPSAPFIEVNPVCGFGPSVQFTLQGFNWIDSATPIVLYWEEEGEPQTLREIIPAPHSPTFQRLWTVLSVPDGVHTVRAISGATIATATFEVPCPNITPTVTTTPPTATSAPADLTIIGVPELLSTRPIVGYLPVEFRVVITNTGTTDINTQFWADLFFDPDPSNVFTNTIVAVSNGYVGVNTLAGQTSQVLTITSRSGFQGPMTTTRVIYAMVDSEFDVAEPDEGNNISIPLYLSDVTPGVSPTPSATPGGADQISGIVRSLISGWVPQFRAVVYLVEAGTVVGITESDVNGYYAFSGLVMGSPYDVHACLVLSPDTFVGGLTGITPPNPFADIFMIADPAGCPY